MIPATIKAGDKVIKNITHFGWGKQGEDKNGKRLIGIVDIVYVNNNKDGRFNMKSEHFVVSVMWSNNTSFMYRARDLDLVSGQLEFDF